MLNVVVHKVTTGLYMAKYGKLTNVRITHFLRRNTKDLNRTTLQQILTCYVNLGIKYCLVNITFYYSVILLDVTVYLVSVVTFIIVFVLC